MSPCHTPNHSEHSATLRHSDARNTSSFADLLGNISLTLWQIVPPVLLLMGTLGNVMIVVVMRGMRDAQSTACLSLYFTALAVSDQCLCVVAEVWLWVDGVLSWPPSFFYLNLLCSVPWYVFYTCSVTSAWFLVAMTYQRVISVVAPHRVAVLCTVRTGKSVIALIVAFSSTVNFHILFTFAYRHEYGKCLYPEKYSSFIYIFTWLDLFWGSLIPFLLLIVGNSVLIRQVIRSIALSRQMRWTAGQAGAGDKVYPMTVTLILTSAVFLVMTSPICIFHTYRRALGFGVEDGDLRAVFNLVETVCFLLWGIASASNFYIYLLSGKKFREEAKAHLCWHSRHGVKTNAKVVA